MKTSLCVLVAALFGVTFAQDQNYTFSDDSFTYLVRIYDDVAIGELAFGINTYFGSSVDSEPTNITEYAHGGIDGAGTLHLIRSDNDYTLDSQELSSLSVVPGQTLTFVGELSSPDLEISTQETENGKISITLVNTDEFEVFTE